MRQIFALVLLLIFGQILSWEYYCNRNRGCYRRRRICNRFFGCRYIYAPYGNYLNFYNNRNVGSLRGVYSYDNNGNFAYASGGNGFASANTVSFNGGYGTGSHAVSIANAIN